MALSVDRKTLTRSIVPLHMLTSTSPSMMMLSGGSVTGGLAMPRSRASGWPNAPHGATAGPGQEPRVGLCAILHGRARMLFDLAAEPTRQVSLVSRRASAAPAHTAREDGSVITLDGRRRGASPVVM